MQGRPKGGKNNYHSKEEKMKIEMCIRDRSSVSINLLSWAIRSAT